MSAVPVATQAFFLTPDVSVPDGPFSPDNINAAERNRLRKSYRKAIWFDTARNLVFSAFLESLKDNGIVTYFAMAAKLRLIKFILRHYDIKSAEYVISSRPVWLSCS